MVRYVVKDEVADLMQIPHTKWHKVAKAINQVGKVAVTAKDNNALVRQVLSKATAMMLEGQLRMLNNGEQAHFDIPCALGAD